MNVKRSAQSGHGINAGRVVAVQRGFVFAAVKEREDTESGWEDELGLGVEGPPLGCGVATF